MSDNGNPGGVCSVCSHADLEAVNAAILAGESMRSIGTRYGLAKSAVSRHKLRCLPLSRALQEARERRLDTGPVEAVPDAPMPRETRSLAKPAARMRDSRSVVQELEDIAGLLRGALEDAAAVKGGISLPIVRELRGTLELIVKSVLALESRDGEDTLSPVLQEYAAAFDGLSAVAQVKELVAAVTPVVPADLLPGVVEALRHAVEDHEYVDMFSRGAARGMQAQWRKPWEPAPELAPEAQPPDVVSCAQAPMSTQPVGPAAATAEARPPRDDAKPGARTVNITDRRRLWSDPAAWTPL